MASEHNPRRPQQWRGRERGGGGRGAAAAPPLRAAAEERPHSTPAPGEDWLVGPHAVEEALRAGRRPLQYLLLARERAPSPRQSALAALARERGVAVRLEPRAVLDRAAAGVPHQGVMARGEARAVVELEELMARAQAGRRWLVALDGIEDPHNLGAILRSAAAAGAEGAILLARRAAGLSAAVERIAAGALEYLPVARVANLAQALPRLQQAGFWVYGLDAAAPKSIWETDFQPALVLVIGAEHHGLHRLIRERCDALCSIPMQPGERGGVASLNASVAAGIAFFELVRQRAAKGGPDGNHATHH